MVEATPDNNTQITAMPWTAGAAAPALTPDSGAVDTPPPTPEQLRIQRYTVHNPFLWQAVAAFIHASELPMLSGPQACKNTSKSCRNFMRVRILLSTLVHHKNKSPEREGL